jgi:tetrapyrrole methylase family protein / MazG family protein
LTVERPAVPLVPPTITVVGLGPGGEDFLTQGTLAAIAGSSRRFLRTRRHPAAVVMGSCESFDQLYDNLGSFDEVYTAIVERLIGEALASPEPVLYAVPGSPLVAEHTVELLLADVRVAVKVVPALSFLDLTWARLGVDPHTDGVRVIDGLRFAEASEGERGPLLVSQCHSKSVLSDIKCTPAEPPDRVTVLQRLGLPDELITDVAWDDLDRVIEPDHLTSLWIPVFHAPLRTEMTRLVSVMDRLRADCPWDQEQTHVSLAPYAIEEAYELAEVIAADAHPDAGDTHTDHLVEELGDLLFQTVFHACLGTEDGRFTLADVARVLSDKLVRRHPHVFGDVEVADAAEVVRNWDNIKAAERARSSGERASIDPMDGLTEGLPALSYAWKVIKRANKAGFSTEPVAAPTEHIGEYLLGVVFGVRAAGKDPEVELRLAAARYRDQVRAAVQQRDT